MSSTEIRAAGAEDLPAVRLLVESIGVLDLHTPYTYWTVRQTGIMLLAVDGADLRGFVMGIWTEPHCREAFLWQIGVAPSAQGRGIGLLLLNRFASAVGRAGCRSFSTTIDPANRASLALFDGFVRRAGHEFLVKGETGSMGGLMKSENLYRISLDRSA
jgi:L-2,4-diaminobutyric acid acetyltransferase